MRNELIRFLFFAGRHRRFRTSHSVFIEEKNKQTNNQQQQVSASLCPNKPWQVRIFSNYFTIFVFGHSKDEFWTPAESEALEWDGHRRTRGTRHARRTGNWLLPQCVATWLSVGVSAISTRHILGRLNAVSSRPTKRQFHPTMTRCSRNKAPPRFRRRFSFASAPAISLRACVPDFDSFFLFLSHMLQCNRVPGRFLGFDSVERVETDDDADKSGTISNGRPEIAAKKKKSRFAKLRSRRRRPSVRNDDADGVRSVTRRRVTRRRRFFFSFLLLLLLFYFSSVFLISSLTQTWLKLTEIHSNLGQWKEKKRSTLAGAIDKSQSVQRPTQ